MGVKSEVDWTEHSRGFWRGCRKVSAGCRNCYAERDLRSYGIDCFGDSARRMGVENASKDLRKWNRKAKANGRREVVFVNPQADFFEDAHGLEDARRAAWKVFGECHNLFFLILTKRDAEMVEWMDGVGVLTRPWLCNVGLGVTIETNAEVGRLRSLDKVVSVLSFVSMEPALEFVDFSSFRRDQCPKCLVVEDFGSRSKDQNTWCHNCESATLWQTSLPFDWLIAGCESGPRRRRVREAAFALARDQAVAARIPFFLKQMDVDGELVKMPELDGVVWDQKPDWMACEMGASEK